MQTKCRSMRIAELRAETEDGGMSANGHLLIPSYLLCWSVQRTKYIQCFTSRFVWLNVLIRACSSIQSYTFFRGLRVHLGCIVFGCYHPAKKKSYLVLILVVWDIRVNHIKYMASCSTSIGNGYDFRAAFRWYVFNNDSKKVSNRCMFKANMLGSSFLCNEIDKLLLYFQN